MKKTYVKPMLYAEEFQLVEHISLNCATDLYEASFSNGWLCSIRGKTSNQVMFTTNVSGCAGANDIYDADWKDDEYMASYMTQLCYNVHEVGQMFSS